MFELRNLASQEAVHLLADGGALPCLVIGVYQTKMKRRNFVGALLRAAPLLWARGLGLDEPTTRAYRARSSHTLQSGRASDSQTLEWARDSTDRHRKGLLRVKVIDAEQRPVPRTRVEATLVQHAFLFGGNLLPLYSFDDPARSERFEKSFASLFNMAVIPFYWGALEPGPGGLRFDRQRAMFAWAKRHGMAIKGHPILWGTPPWGWPAWRGPIPSRAQRLDHIRAVLSVFGDDVRYWDVVNEPLHVPAIEIDEPYRLARQVAPGAHLIVNEYGALADPRRRFFRLLKKALASGIPFDGIGLQGHHPDDWAFPLATVRSTLDLFARLGKQIHISELAFASNGRRVLGSPWRGRWSEEVQAEYAEDFYRVAIAHPAAASITWWLVTANDWRPKGELLHSDLTPRSVYARLDRLINGEWKTKHQGLTDDRGELEFSGFFGRYEIKLRDCRPEHIVFADFQSRDDSQITIRLAAHCSAG